MAEGTSSPDSIESKPDSLPDIQQKAVKKFGTTSYPEEAGYILSDGTFLKMTYEDHIQHGRIVKVYPGKSSDDAMLEFMTSGAIRFARKWGKPELAYAEFREIPNDGQIISLMRAIKDVDQLALEMSGLPPWQKLSEFYQFPRGSDIHKFIQKAKELSVVKSNLKAT